jgi:hypothetical protein
MPSSSEVSLKIEILLHEYDTLREEIMSRYSAQFQAIGVFGAVFVGLLAAIATGMNAHVGYSLIVLSFFIFLALFVWADNDITRAATRLIELEKEINGRAEERLLVWESNRVWGGGLLHILSRKYRNFSN